MGERTHAPSTVHGPLTVKYAEACVGIGGGEGEGGGGLAAAAEQSLSREQNLPELYAVFVQQQ